jgi:hypothetical protein
MLNGIFICALILNFISTTIATCWIFKLYIKNKSYVRDIFLICIGHLIGILNTFSILWLFTFKDIYVYNVASISMLIYSLFSVYLLTNISVSSLKWTANFLKSIIFFFAILSIIAQKILVYHVIILLIVTFDQFFCELNGNSKFDRCFDVFLGLSTFIFIYVIETIIGSQQKALFAITTQLFNLVLFAILFHRIKEIKSSTDLKFGLRKSMKKMKSKKVNFEDEI